MTKPRSQAKWEAPPAPAGLSEAAQELWEAATARPRSRGRLAILEQALRSFDRAEQARRLLDTEGLTTTTATTGAVHISPLAKLEREHRALFTRLWSDVGMDYDAAVDAKVWP